MSPEAEKNCACAKDQTFTSEEPFKSFKSWDQMCFGKQYFSDLRIFAYALMRSLGDET